MIPAFLAAFNDFKQGILPLNFFFYSNSYILKEFMVNFFLHSLNSLNFGNSISQSHLHFSFSLDYIQEIFIGNKELSLISWQYIVK